MTTQGATERPWAAVETGWQPWEGAIQILGADGQIIGYTASGANKKQNAALIIAAVKAYDATDSKLEAYRKGLEEIAATDQYPDSDDTASELREVARHALATGG